MNNFSLWLKKQISERQLTQAELARRCHTSSATLSRILRDERRAGVKMCAAIANALNVPLDDVYREVGYLPQEKNDDRIISEISHIMSRFDNQNKTEVLDFVRMKSRRANAKDKKRSALL